MITTNIIWIILFTSITLLLLGFYFQKKALLLIILGGIILLGTGLTTFTDPISIPTMNDTYIYDNGTLINIEQSIIPTPINPRINTILSWVMMILGLASIIGASIKIYDSRYDDDDPEQIQIFDK